MLIYKLNNQIEDDGRSVTSHRSHKAEIKPKLKLAPYVPSPKPTEVNVRMYIVKVSAIFY